MNPPTPNKAVRIGPDSQPVFPCWLYRPKSALLHWPQCARGWFREEFSYPTSYLLSQGITHYRPDQPEAPTFAPEEEPCHICGEPDSKSGSSVCSAAHGQIAPDWVMEAAHDICDIENICIGGDYSDSTARAVQPDKIATIIRKHAPSSPAVEGMNKNWHPLACITMTPHDSQSPATLQSAAENAATELGAIAEAIFLKERSLSDVSHKDLKDLLLRHFAFVDGLVKERDALRAELESSRSQWRMSSVCRELNAELEKAQAECDLWKQRAITNEVGYNKAEEYLARVIAERDAAVKEVQDTFKQWLGRDYMHLPLPEAVGALRAVLEKEASELRAELERLDRGPHSCSDTCQRPMCVMRRQLAAADVMALQLGAVLTALSLDTWTDRKELMAVNSLSAYQAARTQGGSS